MAYLGNSPARSFISFERQVFTIVNSQTAYTLDHSVTNENDIRLVVNNVVQEPGSGKAYTASGTTLTLSAALTNGTDEMYCVYLGRATATEAPGAGSVGTSQLASDAVTGAKIADDAISDEHLDPTAITGQTAETTIADDDLILLSDTSASAALKKMTRANFVSGVGGDMTPAFCAANTSGSDQTLTNNTETKVNFATEVFDTNSAYDTSTSRFTVPSGEAGKYFISSNCTLGTGAQNDVNYINYSIYKNGSRWFRNHPRFDGNEAHTLLGFVQDIMDLSVGDYIEIYALIHVDQNTPKILVSNTDFRPVFQGYKILGA